MTINVAELEAAGYVIHREGRLSKDGVTAKSYMIAGRLNAEVYLPRQEGKSKPWTYVRVHRVVAEKFVPNPHGLTSVGFKKGLSCRWSNLIWVEPHDPTSVKTKKARVRREGMVLLELGDITWQVAHKKYGINQTTAYNIWRKNNATI